MVLTKRLMGINRAPRRINRNAGGRNKKTNIKSYPKIKVNKEKKQKKGKPF